MTPLFALIAITLLAQPRTWSDETGSVTCQLDPGFSPMARVAGAFERADPRERLLMLPHVPSTRVPDSAFLAEVVLRRLGASSIVAAGPGSATGFIPDDRIHAAAAVVSSSHGYAGVLLLSLSGGRELAARAAQAASACRVLEPLATPGRIRESSRTLSFPVPAGAQPTVRDGNGALTGGSWEIRLGEVKAYSAPSPLAQAERLLLAAGAKATSKTMTRAGGSPVALAQGNAGATFVQVAVFDLDKKFGTATLRADPDGLIAGQQAFLALVAGVEATGGVRSRTP
ncbi:MAG: hypothetical protein ACYC8T_34650 [Myxococcaceae bacterium]